MLEAECDCEFRKILQNFLKRKSPQDCGRQVHVNVASKLDANYHLAFMGTYLLTWSRWVWPDIEKAVEQTAAGIPYPIRWSVHAHKKIQVEDRVFLLKQGKKPRGIVASGRVVSAPYRFPHWDPAKNGQEVMKVDVEFERVVAPTPGSILPRAALDCGALACVRWNTQASGISISPDAAAELEQHGTTGSTGCGRVSLSLPLK